MQKSQLNFIIDYHYYIKFWCNFEETNDTRVFHWKTLPLGRIYLTTVQDDTSKEPVIVS